MATGGAVPAGPIAGVWHVHTYYLTVGEDGHGVFSWPIHTECGTGSGQGPPPCDQIVHGDVIEDGGYAVLTVTGRAGDTAEGTISASTEPSTLSDGSVALRVGPDGVLHLTTPGVHPSDAYGYLCGPRAAALPVSEQVAEGINCGA